MLTYDEFIKKRKGKASDYDGVPSGNEVQCVDLIKFYLSEVFGIKPGSWGDASKYYYNFDWKAWNGYPQMHEKFTKIPNTPEFVPAKGDICVWGDGLSKWGHISIADGTGNTSYFYSYDQNWNGKECKRVKHVYSGFLGVLRPKRKIRIDANIRKGPGTSFEIVKELSAGKLVTVYEQKNNWTRIGKDEWVSSNLILSI